jgi:rhomboid protease GluP
MASTYLLLSVALTAGVFGVTAFGRRSYSWTIVSLLFVIAAVAGYLLDRDRSGFLVGGAFALLVVGPAVANVQLGRLVAARRYQAAKLVARSARLLHPFGVQRGWLELVTAWELASLGTLDEADAVLRACSVMGRDDCMLEILRLRNRWGEVIANITARRNEDIFESNHGVVLIRAYGETGDPRMLSAFTAITTSWKDRDEHAEGLATAQMFFAAFLGEVALVDALVAGPLAHFHPSIKAFWRATALSCAGRSDEAASSFTILSTDADWRTQNAAKHRLAHPPIAADPRGRDELRGISERLRDSARYGARAHAHAPRPVIAQMFAALLVLVHLAAIAAPDVVYAHGLLWSPAVLHDAEWWRIGTAMLLHAGWLHLALNVLALVWFGPFVERSLGRPRFALVVIAGGAGCFALLTLLDALDIRDPIAALGASGAVMAIVGASIAIFVRGSLSDRSPTARSRLRNMVGFVVIQSVFDSLAPQVSMTGHLAGLAVGFVVALPRRRP